MKKKRFDIHCPNCGRKYLKSDLLERGYIDILKVGYCITCPNDKCEHQWFEEFNNEL